MLCRYGGTTCGNAGVLVFSLLMGTLVTTVGYTPFFVGLAVLDLLGAVILWTVVREPEGVGMTPPAPATPAPTTAA